MNQHQQIIVGLLALITLSACRVEPDWTAELASSASQTPDLTLHSVLAVEPKHALAIYQGEGADWRLALYSQQGLRQREGVIEGLPVDTELVSAARYGDRSFLLLKTAGGSRLLSLNDRLELEWQRRFEPTNLRDMAIHGRQLYLTGDSTMVLDWGGETLIRVDHSDGGYQSLAVGLFGDAYVAGHRQVAAYSDGGGLLWQRHFPGTTPVDDSQLLWSDGQLYYARMNNVVGGMTLYALSARSGDSEWSKSIEPMDKGFHMERAPQRLLVRDDGILLALQSTSGGRQLTALEGDVGRLHWQVDYASTLGTQSTLAEGLDGEDRLLWSGAGRSELYSNGRRLARASHSHTVLDSRVAAVPGGAYVAESVLTPGGRQSLQLSYFTF